MSPRAARRRPMVPDLPVPKRPLRDSVVFYGILALLLVLMAWATGGRLLPGELTKRQPELGAVLVAVVFFVVATAWSWWRFRVRLAREAEAKQRA